MGAGDGEGVVHGGAGSGEGVGLGEGAMVFKVLFSAAGEGLVGCCSGGMLAGRENSMEVEEGLLGEGG